MVAITGLCAIFIILYCVYIVQLFVGVSQLKNFSVSDEKPSIGFSLIIPFRNEAENLPRLLDSIAKLNYPKENFELIFIDDSSTDDSASIINRWRMQNGLVTTTLIDNIQMTASAKKNAILRAIPIAQFDWVITTDADCVLPEKWLSAFKNFIGTNSFEMIAAPVKFSRAQGLLSAFQRVDFLSLQAVTMGSFGINKPFMCNGANFAYTKKLFREIGGFTGNESIVSGDDVFLLQSVAAKNPEKLGYLKSTDAIVETLPEKSLGKLFNQRVRWAAKANAYNNPYAEQLAAVTFLANAFLLASAIASGFGFGDPVFVGALFVLKLFVDWLILAKANRFLRSQKFLFPVFAAIIHPVFITTVALYAAFGRYSWKGRKFRV